MKHAWRTLTANGTTEPVRWGLWSCRDESDEACDEDTFLFLYGFTTDDFTEVRLASLTNNYSLFCLKTIAHKTPEFIAHFTEDIDPRDPSFTWERVLDWDPPATTCLDTVPELVKDHSAQS